jgi:hypothetical protein
MKRNAMNGIILGIFTIVYLVVFAVVTAHSFSFDLMDVYGNEGIDVNKPGAGYEMTCTMAAMANAVTFALGQSTEYAYAFYYDAVNRIGNKPTTTIAVWELMMDLGNVEKGLARYNNIYISGKNLGRDWLDIITSTIHSGNVVILWLDVDGQDLDHAVTVYGFSFNDNGTTDLLYVDSDDKVAHTFLARANTDKYNTTRVYFPKTGSAGLAIGRTATIKGFTAIRVMVKK